MKKIKIIKKVVPVLVWILVFSLSVTGILATDNADSGNNASQSAVAGYYRSKDWMYKVSIYVGKSNTTNVNGSIKDFYLVGQPIFIAPTTLNIPSNRNVYASPYNKFDYLRGEKIKPKLFSKSGFSYFPDVPAIPIINKGNINAVKQYFGDTKSLFFLLDEIAKVQGTTKEALLTANAYTIGGNTKHLSAEEILPVKGADDKYRNLVPYLVVYEPIAIGYLTDGKTALAFTATEYAIAQKDGLMNFFTKSLGKVSTAPQLMWGLTHRDLPNSIFLEESWLGLPARAEVANRKTTKQWTKALIDNVSDTIIRGSGIGMRFLQAKATPLLAPPAVIEPNTYKADTEVITSIKVSVPESTNRIDRFYPGNPGYVHFDINGETKTHTVIIPDGGEQLAWVKWRTPSEAGNVIIKITMSDGIQTESGGSEHWINAKIVKIKENAPPDPEATDSAKDFGYKEVEAPSEPEAKENTWGEYFATWHEHWVDNGEWVEQYRKDPKTGKDILIGSTWESNWEDEGWWDWEYRTYYAKASAEMKLIPSDETPTAQKGKDGIYEMKSGYGVKTEVKAVISTNAPSSDHYTNAGTVITYFPEFQYKTFWRMLESTKANVFSFQKNPDSQWEAPVHFTPLWYPDKDYTIYGQVEDIWTPAGMLRVNVTDTIKIKGNVYDDWHIGPTKPE